MAVPNVFVYRSMLEAVIRLGDRPTPQPMP